MNAKGEDWMKTFGNLLGSSFMIHLMISILFSYLVIGDIHTDRYFLVPIDRPDEQLMIVHPQQPPRHIFLCEVY